MRDLLRGRIDDARRRAAVIARYAPVLPRGPPRAVPALPDRAFHARRSSQASVRCPSGRTDRA